MIKETEGLRFLRLELEKFKNIDKKVIEIGGQSIIVMGKNGSGKSSLIQALMSPLDAKVVPSVPIKKGEERATVSVTIGGKINGEEKQYTVDMYFTPKNNSGRIVVTDQNGETVKSPATFIKTLLGNYSFDVMKWLNDPKAKKLETIKNLTGCGKQIDLINKEIKEKADIKKAKKARAEEIEAVMKNHQYSQEEIDKYSEPIKTEELQNLLTQVSQNQKTWDEFKVKVDGLKNSKDNSFSQIKYVVDEISKKEQEIIKLQNELVSLKTRHVEMNNAIIEIDSKISKGEEWLNNNKRPDSNAIIQKMNDAAAHNENHSMINNLAEKQREMLAAKQDVGKIDIEINTLENNRSKIISESQLPVQGLTFTDDEILLDNVPLEEGQINTARLFDVGVEVAMALNPGLKTIFLHDGSLFDKENLKIIVDKIEAKGYQAIVEVVSEDESLEVKFTEEQLS